MYSWWPDGEKGRRVRLSLCVALMDPKGALSLADEAQAPCV